MCDYSLHGVASRPAKVGDKLVTTQFWSTTTRGFAAARWLASVIARDHLHWSRRAVPPCACVTHSKRIGDQVASERLFCCSHFEIAQGEELSKG